MLQNRDALAVLFSQRIIGRDVNGVDGDIPVAQGYLKNPLTIFAQVAAGFGIKYNRVHSWKKKNVRPSTPSPIDMGEGAGGICVNLRDKRPSFLKNGFGRTIVQLPEQHQEQ
jgi:hypothetical protein